jgi:hypothetical protein
MEADSSWFLLDYFGVPLQDDDYMYVAWTGPDGQIDPPAMAGDIGAPTGDDSLLAEGDIKCGMFFSVIPIWGVGEGHPQVGDSIYCRIFDGPRDSLTNANFYADSQPYECGSTMDEDFICTFPGDPGGGHTDTALDSTDLAPPEMIDDLSIALETGAKSATGDMRLTWTEPGDDVGVVRYVIYRSTAPSSLGDSLAGTADTTYLDVGAAGTVGTNYFYAVKAADAVGHKSQQSYGVGEFDVYLIDESSSR